MIGNDNNDNNNNGNGGHGKQPLWSQFLFWVALPVFFVAVLYLCYAAFHEDWRILLSGMVGWVGAVAFGLLQRPYQRHNQRERPRQNILPNEVEVSPNPSFDGSSLSFPMPRRDAVVEGLNRLAGNIIGDDNMVCMPVLLGFVVFGFALFIMLQSGILELWQAWQQAVAIMVLLMFSAVLGRKLDRVLHRKLKKAGSDGSNKSGSNNSDNRGGGSSSDIGMPLSQAS